MENTEKHNKEYYVIDLMHILKSLWSKAWLILSVSILTGVITLLCSLLLITPKYSSGLMVYVNNDSAASGTGLSSSDINASQSLVKTYIIILSNNRTLQEVIDYTGVDYTCDELLGMIDAHAVNNTEILQITVTCDDPYEAQKIADGVAVVLPERIKDIIEGSSMVLVDSPTVDTDKVSPNLTMNTLLGVVVGFLVVCFVIVFITLLDDTIRSEDYVLQNYDVPILARIPDLNADESSKQYAYYKEYGTANRTEDKTR